MSKMRHIRCNEVKHELVDVFHRPKYARNSFVLIFHKLEAKYF